MIFCVCACRDLTACSFLLSARGQQQRCRSLRAGLKSHIKIYKTQKIKLKISREIPIRGISCCIQKISNVTGVDVECYVGALAKRLYFGSVHLQRSLILMNSRKVLVLIKMISFIMDISFREQSYQTVHKNKIPVVGAMVGSAVG